MWLHIQEASGRVELSTKGQEKGGDTLILSATDRDSKNRKQMEKSPWGLTYLCYITL